jgi:hypothetical protein
VEESGGELTPANGQRRRGARFNGTRLDEKVNVPEGDAKYAEEVVPTSAEVQSLLDHSPLRVKVAVSLMAFSGLRPATMGDAQGLDGPKVNPLSVDTHPFRPPPSLSGFCGGQPRLPPSAPRSPDEIQFVGEGEQQAAAGFPDYLQGASAFHRTQKESPLLTRVQWHERSHVRGTVPSPKKSRNVEPPKHELLTPHYAYRVINYRCLRQHPYCPE